MKPVKLPINGVLDLHTFDPRQLPSLLDDYLLACLQSGIYHLRIIHGKGSGVLRRRVHALLSKHRLVESFGDAPAQAGGWGATIVKIKHDKFVE